MNLQKVVKAAGGTIPGGKAQNAKPQASPMAGEKKSVPEQKPDAFNEKVVVRQGDKTKKLDETVHDHLVKNGDYYSDYSQNDVEELVLKPSGYRLKEEWTTNRKDGSYLSVYTNGKNTLKIEFSKNDEIFQNANAASAYLSQTRPGMSCLI